MFDRKKCLKQPSILTFKGAESGFTAAGFTFDLGLQYKAEYAEEYPTIPIRVDMLGVAPTILVSFLETSNNTLAQAFGGLFTDGGARFPSKTAPPGTDLIGLTSFVGSLSLVPRYSDYGWFISAPTVISQVVGMSRLSTIDRLSLDVLFTFLMDDNQHVLDMSFVLPE